MAYDENGDPIQDTYENEDFWTANAPPQSAAPSSVPAGGYTPPAPDIGPWASGYGAAPVGSVQNPDTSMIQRDQNSWAQTLQAAGGNLYDPSDLAGVVRNVSYARNAGQDPANYINQQIQIYKDRANNAPGGSGGQQQSGTPGSSSMGSMGASGVSGAPNYMQPFTGTFTPPTVADLWASPGFQGRLDAGTRQIQHGAAAQGTLLTGGTLKGLDTFAQDYASNEYDKLYNENEQQYMDKFNIWNTNETNRFNSQQTNRLTDFNIADSDRNFARTTSNDQWAHGLDVFGMNRTGSNDILDNAYRYAALGRPTAPN